MKPILERIEDALAQFSRGEFTGNVPALLMDAKQGLAKKQEADRIEAIASSQQAWKLYRQFEQRIKTVAEALVKAEDVYATDVYVERWTLWDNTAYPNEPKRINVDTRYRVTQTDDDDEDLSDVDGHDGFGQGYKNRTKHLTFPEEWLWRDEWQHEAKVLSLQTRLATAELECKRWKEAIPRRVKDVEEAQRKQGEAAHRATLLQAELDRAKEGKA